MEGAVTEVAVTVAEEDTVVGGLVEAMQEDLVEVDFMAEVLEDTSVVEGTEEAVTGEDAAITRTEDMPTPTSAFVGILTIIPITLTGTGLHSVILMAGATESGCHIIEGRVSS
jgi:hypothetical protein